MTPTKSSAERVEIANRLHSAAIHLLRRVRGQDETSGLSPARLSALSVVVFGGPVTLGRLASAERVTAPTMTRLVAALEADGLVSRRDDVRDRRVVWLSATAKGKKIIAGGKASPRARPCRRAQRLERRGVDRPLGSGRVDWSGCGGGAEEAQRPRPLMTRRAR